MNPPRYLTVEDANCWWCGSKDIEDLRPKVATGDELVLDVEDLLRHWASSGQFSDTYTSTGATHTWSITT